MEPVIVRLRLLLLIVAGLVLQMAMLDRVRVLGVAPDVMVLLAASAGILAGPERGAVVGFGAGLAIDLFLQTTPAGLSALVFGLVGYGAGVMSEGTVRAAWWIPVLTAALASGTGQALFAFAAAVVGRSEFVRPHLATVVGLVALFDGILAWPILRATAWAVGEGQQPGGAVL